MKKFTGRLIFMGIMIITLIWVAPQLSSAATYYLSPKGSNSHAGTSLKPWATPAYGASRLVPGDTLIIKSGTYILSSYETDIIRPPSGTPGHWVTIKGEPGGHVMLACRDNLMAAVDLSGTHYVMLENLEITHDPSATGESAWFRDGVSIVGAPASNIILSNLYIHHLDEFGVDAQDVENLLIQDSRIEYCGFGAVGGPTGDAGGLRNTIIRRCFLSYSGHYYQGGDGSDRPYDRPDGFGIEPSLGPVFIEDTTASHNYGDGLDSKADNTTIRRCIVANNSCDGVKLWGGGSAVENTLIYGRGDGSPEVTPWAAIVIDTTENGATFSLYNITVDDVLGNNYLMYAQYDDETNIFLNISNCIFSGRGPNCPIWLRDTVSLTMDHTLFWFPNNDILFTHGDTDYTVENIGSIGKGIVTGNPLFASQAWGTNGDYHLMVGSPAIDAGIPLPDIPNDLEGKPRPQGHGYDMGAYER